MKLKIILFFTIISLLSCDSSVKADFDTIKTKKLILVGDDNKEYELTVKKDSTGNAVLNITPETTP